MDSLRFAATKIQPPRLRATRVDRPRLDAALGEALLGRRVVLLQAPAGFGKTAALASQLDRLPADSGVAWVSLDQDDDAPRLFACLVAALEPFDLPWRVAPQALVAQVSNDATDGPQRAVVQLLNALAEAGTGRGVIVLDDLHRVQAPPLHRLIDAMIERLPPHWTVVLSTRVAPPLALERWRAADELVEFGADELRFSADEAAALAAAEGVNEVAAVDALYARTQGWPAGVRLSLAALRARPEGAARAGGGLLVQRHLFDYLASEVLDDMPAPLHDFLLQCSILPELTAARAAAVTGDVRAAHHLEEIERRGLFVSTLDAVEPTLVLHDLFRDALQERLRRRMPERLPDLLHRAAAGEPDPARRVAYLLRAGDAAAAESVLAASAPELFLDGGAAEVEHLIEQFPAPVRSESPGLLRLAGLVACLRWQWTEMARLMRMAAQAAERLGDEAGARLAQAYLAAANYPLGRNDESERLLEALRPLELDAPTRMIALVGEYSQQFRRGEHHLVPRTWGELVLLLEEKGSLFDWWQCAPGANLSTVRGARPWLERYFTGALARLGDRALPMRGDVQIQLAFSHLYAGRIDECEVALRQADDDSRWLACTVDTEVSVQVLHAILEALRGQADAVAARLAALLAREDHSTEERRRLWHHQVAAYAVRLTEVLGSDAAALRRWGALLNDRPFDSDVQTPRAQIVRARHVAALGRWPEAAERWHAMLPHAPRMDVHGQCVEIHLRAAHALWRTGDRERAVRAMVPALERMLGEGDRGQALMCGPTVLQALAGVDWTPTLAPALQAELRAAAALALVLRGEPASASPALDRFGLSAREREVLERIAAGDSNKLIARGLDISPHTVKRHVANILDKLALSSRGQAAAWLREHAQA